MTEELDDEIKKLLGQESEPEHVSKLKRANELLKMALLNPDVAHNTNTLQPVKRGENLNRKEKSLLWKNPSTSFLVTMFYSNRSKRTFIILGTSPYFIDKSSGSSKGYLIYSPASWYDINQNHNHYFYAEDYIMPIDSLHIVGGKNVSFAIHPDNFREIWESQELKIVLTAKSLKKWLFWIILITAIILFIVFIILMIVGIPAVISAFHSASGVIGGGGAPVPKVG